ncbi:TlpA family protein disulfide reductase [Psychroflexus montanilacus]|uniref:TlpA family protein disulfide reductase n=1 Tax=Psychroflexus montanilacus TaxID=2873598 RepID=UPI001CCE6015|nr:redoxin domain-containing protein [Psychroflexus montanilacus]MBZ9652753.1 redoxin domain-containing protein [Psychroflexus montanilacus]
MQIQLKSLEGKELTLTQLLSKGKVNLILFYNTYCLGCTGRAIPFAHELTKDFPELNLVVIHTNFGNQSFSKAEVLDIFRSRMSPFDIYIDPDAEAYKHFQCEGTPHWVILDRELQTFRSIFGSQNQSQNRLFYALESLN